MDSEIDSSGHVDRDISIIPVDDIDIDDQNDDNNKEELKIKTALVFKHGSVTLSFPECRTNRQQSHLEVTENLAEFKGNSTLILLENTWDLMIKTRN